MRINSEMSEWFDVKCEAGLPHVTMGFANFPDMLVKTHGVGQRSMIHAMFLERNEIRCCQVQFLLFADDTIWSQKQGGP